MAFTLFADWKRKLLANHDLERPDRRALYQYRVTEAEFIELENLLREWLGKLLNKFDLGQITRLTGFSALFVLYAAEWWRRHGCNELADTGDLAAVTRKVNGGLTGLDDRLRLYAAALRYLGGS